MACKTAKEAWNRLKEEYQGSDRTRQIQVLNLKREFESLNMQKDETISKYADRISLIINNIRHLGDEFTNKQIVEKVLVTLPERFESKISSLEESKDLSKLSLGELMSALQAQEHRRAMKREKFIEGAFSIQKQKGKQKFHQKNKGKHDGGNYSGDVKRKFSSCKH
ncbi:uncharacterized protein [Solanum lycopersicum]|uniref:uncharacterized protein n=1 Tax=Solanum lycopersicum TaxID=4081 RepID=UPI003748680B